MLLVRDLARTDACGFVLPHDIVDVGFDPARHARAARALLNEAYAGGGGDVVDDETWWARLSEDEEYDPEAVFVLEQASSGRMVGFAQCWTSGFVKDIAIAKTHRRLGVGAYLISRVTRHFKAKGLKTISLKVTRDNPSGAIAFYESLGFSEAEV